MTDFFGTDDDELLATSGNLIARISRIVIVGTVAGTTDPNDHFGFVAAQIGKFTTDGIKLPLTGGGRDVLELGATGDVTLREPA